MRDMDSSTFATYPLSFTKLQLVLVSLLLAFLGGCLPQSGTDAQGVEVAPVRGMNETARLSLFLHLKDPNGPGIHLEIKDLELLAGQEWLPVRGEPLSLDSTKIAATQVFLGGRWVPPGRYERIRFTVTQISMQGASENYEALSSDTYTVELQLPESVSLAKGDSQSLFVSWDVEATLASPEDVGMAMTIAKPVKQLLVNLIYTACPDIDTVFVVRADTNWVADSFGVDGHPTYLALDPDSSRLRLYVLASKECRIKVVDLTSQRIIESFSIPFTKDPVFMTTSPDGLSAYVLDKAENYIIKLDLLSGRLMTRARLDGQPQYAVFLADRNEVAVSSAFTSQNISLRDPTNLIELRSIGTGDSPDGFLLSNNLLYVAESGDDAISIYDLVNNRTVNRTNVGSRPRRLLDTGNLIYVSNYDSASLSVIYPDLGGVVQEISGLGRPLEMIFNSAYHRIYVADEQTNGLAIVDSVVNQLGGRVNLGARPLGLAIIQ